MFSINYLIILRHSFDINFMTQNEDTKRVPKLSRKTEKVNRFEIMKGCMDVLSGFFELGFQSFAQFKSVILLYEPSIDLLLLKKYWDCRTYDKSVHESAALVLKKLQKSKKY